MEFTIYKGSTIWFLQANLPYLKSRQGLGFSLSKNTLDDYNLQRCISIIQSKMFVQLYTLISSQALNQYLTNLFSFQSKNQYRPLMRMEIRIWTDLKVDEICKFVKL